MKKMFMLLLLLSGAISLSACNKKPEKTSVEVSIEDYIIINDSNREFFSKDVFQYIAIGNNYILISDSQDLYLYNIKNDEHDLLEHKGRIYEHECYDEFEFCLVEFDHLTKIEYDGTISTYDVDDYQGSIVSIDINYIAVCEPDMIKLTANYCEKLIILDKNMNEVAVFDDLHHIQDFIYGSGKEIFEITNASKTVVRNLDSNILIVRQFENYSSVMTHDNYIIYKDGTFAFENDNFVSYSNGVFIFVEDSTGYFLTDDGTVFKEISIEQEHPVVTYINSDMYLVSSFVNNTYTIFDMNDLELDSFESETKLWNSTLLCSKGTEYFVGNRNNRTLFIYNDGVFEAHEYYAIDIAPNDNLYYGIFYGGDEEGIYQVIDGVHSEYTNTFLDSIENVHYFKQISETQLMVHYYVDEMRHAAVFNTDGDVLVDGKMLGFSNDYSDFSKIDLLIIENGIIKKITN